MILAVAIGSFVFAGAGRNMTMYWIKGADHWIIAYNTNFGGFFTRHNRDVIIVELEESRSGNWKVCKNGTFKNRVFVCFYKAVF